MNETSLPDTVNFVPHLVELCVKILTDSRIFGTSPLEYLVFGRGKFNGISDLRDRLSWLSPKAMTDYLTLVIAHKGIQCGEKADECDGLVAAFFTFYPFLHIPSVKKRKINMET